jgi:hypothetical protein
MTSFTGAFLLAYLLSVAFTDEFSFSTTAVQKLVDYQYSFGSQMLIPGKLYSGTITAKWAVPDSALVGLENESIAVKVTAQSEENSSVFFPVLSGAESKTAEAVLRCDVAEGTCSNSSTLSATIPVMFRATEGENAQEMIKLRSELAQDGASDVMASAGSVFDSFAGVFGQNSSNPPPGQENKSEAPQNLLDSFKPEGNSSDPVSFLKNNPLISLAALAIVIIITGAYLLNSRD